MEEGEGVRVKTTKAQQAQYKQMMEDFNEIYGRQSLTSVQKTEIPKICNTIMRATGNSWRVEGKRRFNLYRVRKLNKRAAQPQTTRKATAAKPQTTRKATATQPQTTVAVENDAGGSDFESDAENVSLTQPQTTVAVENDAGGSDFESDAENVSLTQPQTTVAVENDAGGSDFESDAENVTLDNTLNNEGDNASGDADTETDLFERDGMPYLRRNPLRNVRRADRAAQPRTRPLRNVRRADRLAQPRTRLNDNATQTDRAAQTLSPRHAQLSRSPTGDSQMGGEAEVAEDDAGGGNFESAGGESEVAEDVTLDNALNNEIDNVPLNDEGVVLTSCKFEILGCEVKLGEEAMASHEVICPKRCFGCPMNSYACPLANISTDDIVKLFSF